MFGTNKPQTMKLIENIYICSNSWKKKNLKKSLLLKSFLEGNLNLSKTYSLAFLQLGTTLADAGAGGGATTCPGCDRLESPVAGCLFDVHFLQPVATGCTAVQGAQLGHITEC
mgnify:CR=1 FL=1